MTRRPPPRPPPPKTAAKPQATSSLAGVHSWTTATLPSTPDVKPAALPASLTSPVADLLIVDPVAPKAGAPSAVNPVAVLQQNGKRRVLARLDIGEIAKTNPQWQAAWVDATTGKPTPAAPAWLDAPDNKAAAVYPVHFWDADWQKQATAALDKLASAGYDGVCLQGVGQYSRLLKFHSSAGTEMAAFVEALAAHARKSNARFSVLVDGGAGLPAALTDAQKKDYLAAVDGVLARDVFYPGDKPLDNDLAPDPDVLAALDTFQKDGKPIFVTERLADPDKIADFLARAKSKGYLPDAALTAAPPAPAPAAGAQMAAALP